MAYHHVGRPSGMSGIQLPKVVSSSHNEYRIAYGAEVAGKYFRVQKKRIRDCVYKKTAPSI